MKKSIASVLLSTALLACGTYETKKDNPQNTTEMKKKNIGVR